MNSAGPLKANPIYDGRLTADPFSGVPPGGRYTLDSSADMFAFVNQGASVAADRGPYSLTSAQMTRGGKTENITLVSINGTHIPWAEEGHQSTGFVTDVRAGFGIENAYVRSVKADIMKLPPGTKLVIAGHSLGGIVAQELAADPDIRAKYEVLNTVSFGSPVLKPGRQEGAVHRLADKHDPIVLLSWDGLKSDAASRVQGAGQGAQDAFDRSVGIARTGGLSGIFSRDMVNSILKTPSDMAAGANRAAQQSTAMTNVTVRDANMPKGSMPVPGPTGYLSMQAHKQSYADPKAWGGITALGEGYSKATQATITFKQSDITWRMTEPVLKQKGWELPILRDLRRYLSEVDPSQRPDAPGNTRNGTVLASSRPSDAPVDGDRVRTAMATVIGSDAGLPEGSALAGTRTEQVAAIRDLMAGRGRPATLEEAGALLDLAATLPAEHLTARSAHAGDAPAETVGQTPLAQSARPDAGPTV